MLQLLMWTEILRRHALAADNHGLHEKAQALRQQAGNILHSLPKSEAILTLRGTDEKAAELEAAKIQLATLFKNNALKSEYSK